MISLSLAISFNNSMPRKDHFFKNSGGAARSRGQNIRERRIRVFPLSRALRHGGRTVRNARARRAVMADQARTFRAGAGRKRAVRALCEFVRRGKDKGDDRRHVPERKRVSARGRADQPSGRTRSRNACGIPAEKERIYRRFARPRLSGQIGRASCRERV